MKKPVPKYKTSKSRTGSRFSAFVHHTQVKLKGIVHLIDCPKCKEKRLTHHVCQNCGYYGDKKVIDMQKKVEKITKVKA